MCRSVQGTIPTTKMPSSPAFSNQIPRNFAAASVPHLHLHKVPLFGSKPSTAGDSVTNIRATVFGDPFSKGRISEPGQAWRKEERSPVGLTTRGQGHDSVDGSNSHSHHHSVHPDEVGVTPVQRSIASGIGTVFMTLVMTPLDVVRVRLQAQYKLPVRDLQPRGTPQVSQSKKPSVNGTCRTFCSTSWRSGNRTLSASGTRLNGTMDAFGAIIRREGLKKLWSGLPATLVMRIPANIIYFSVYDSMKNRLGFHSGEASNIHSVLVTILASGCARTMAVTVVSPMDLVRTKLQSQSMTYMELGRCLRAGYQAEGLFSLWRGLGATILRDVPYAALYWSNYELLKTQLMRMWDVAEATVSMTFWAGAASGVMAAIVTTPFDVVKTNKQIAIGDAARHKGIACPTRQNTLRMMMQIQKQSGITALFSGVVPRVAMSAPASAILITCYEFILHVFRDVNTKNMSPT
ncbi:mitochondrial glutathione transporter SLC25A40-like [Diadema antillarum]|uniref:mitochondrial glutathione transporter SLC25A40-like n=1 Tax=Diadema antillarum TaxID=105358 RepID=UPI003A861D31